jgi:hypothetical protein
MIFTSKRVSFSIVIALLVGWGIFSLFFMQAAQEVISAESNPLTGGIVRQSGVRLYLEIDKRVYESQGAVLISLRNDSRKKVWLSTSADGCRQAWWAVQVLRQEEEWSAVSLEKTGCGTEPSGSSAFPKHTLRTDTWNGLVPANALGRVFLPAPTGTYRIYVPFQVGDQAAEDWTNDRFVVSDAFTIQ